VGSTDSGRWDAVVVYNLVAKQETLIYLNKKKSVGSTDSGRWDAAVVFNLVAKQ
jgi:hypothetical protein